MMASCREPEHDMSPVLWMRDVGKQLKTENAHYDAAKSDRLIVINYKIAHARICFV